MVDRFICYVVLAVVPVAILATGWRWLSVEVGLAIVLGTVLVAIVVGTVEYVKNPEKYNRR